MQKKRIQVSKENEEKNKVYQRNFQRLSKKYFHQDTVGKIAIFITDLMYTKRLWTPVLIIYFLVFWCKKMKLNGFKFSLTFEKNPWLFQIDWNFLTIPGFLDFQAEQEIIKKGEKYWPLKIYYEELGITVNSQCFRCALISLAFRTEPGIVLVQHFTETKKYTSTLKIVPVANVICADKSRSFNFFQF